MNTLELPITPEDILVINIARIGDTLLNTPAIRALRRGFPRARLTVMAHKKRLAVLENNPDIDVLLPYSPIRRLLAYLTRGPLYDLAVVYGNDPHIFRYARRAGRLLVGYEQRDPAVNALLDRSASPDVGPDRKHSVDVRLRLAAVVGIEKAERGLVYCIKPEEERWAAHWLTQHGIPAGPAVVGLQVAGFPTKSYRDWPAEQFIALGQAVLAEWPARLLLFGGKADRNKAALIQATLGGKAFSLAGRTTLRQSAALLARCTAFVTTDTGMMHLAFALKVPTVAMFHCLHPAWALGPSSRPEIHRVVQMEPQPGEPCTRQLSMASVTPEAVFASLNELLAKAPPGPKHESNPD